jgi:hypothetical protein
MTDKQHSSGQETARGKNRRKAQNYSKFDTATAILHDMVLSLLDTGFDKQHITAALERLADEARGDTWQKELDSRARERQIASAAAARATARRKAAEKQLQN